MSVSQPESGAAVLPDFSSMTEEEQIAYAMQMSLAGGGVFYWTILLFCFFFHFIMCFIYFLINLTLFIEYGEMDTGAPMDTAESAKVSHGIVCEITVFKWSSVDPGISIELYKAGVFRHPESCKEKFS